MLSIKSFLPRSLLGRSLMILVTPVLLIQIITTYVFFERHWNGMSDRLAFGVAGEIAVIASLVESQKAPRDIGAVTDYFTRSLDLSVRFEPGGTLPKGGIVATNGDVFSPANAAKEHVVYGFLSRALDRQVQWPYQLHVDFHEKWVAVSLQLENGVLYVSLPVRRLFSSSGYVFLLWMIGVSFLLLVIAILFMRNQVRPIRRLAIAAERFGKGRDIPASFKPEGAREVRQAARAFRDMQERIRRQIEQRTAMLSGVSHDLRTPLTRMRLQLEMLEDCPDVAALKADIGDMERMIDGYLDFARGEGSEQAVFTDISALIGRAVENMRRQGAAITLAVDDDIDAFLKPIAFERCLMNLLGNALKYGTTVTVRATKRDDVLEVTIDDDGPGIPAGEREAVFRPFYRIDESRNAKTGGVGLGLPIAQDIIHAHGGEIILGDSPQGGLRVVLHLPL